MIDLIGSYIISEGRAMAHDTNELSVLELTGKTAKKINEVIAAFNEHKSHENSELLSVLDYGAIGDGVTDDYAAIVACIAALPEGGKVIFPAKTFYLSSEIIVTKDIIIDFGNAKFITAGARAFTFAGTLKDTQTVTANYVEATSKNAIDLNSVLNVEIGDLINIVANRGSGELFDTSRAYYYKGGNFIVTGISGNKVYFNGSMPFDITAANINVKIYKPIRVRLDNCRSLKGSGSLAVETNLSGITIKYGVNCVINKVETENYQENIALWQCVNCFINLIQTGHAKNIGDIWDGYGIAIRSCTNIFANNILGHSGQHAITAGGQEPCYNINVANAYLKAEISESYGFDLHDNIISCQLENVVAAGYWLAGNTRLTNCKLTAAETTGTNAVILSPSESYKNTNFIFDGCRFGGANIYTKDAFQQTCATRKYFGQIIIKDSRDFSLMSKINTDSAGAKIAMIEKIEINRCKGYSFAISDLLDDLIVRDSDSVKNTNIIAQIAVSAVYQRIKRVLIENCSFPKVYNSIIIMLADYVKINGFYHNTTDYGSDSQTIANITGTLHMENYFNSTGQSGLTLTAITRAFFNNVYWKLATSISAQLLQCTRADGKGISGNSENFDLITATNNDKYKITIAAGVHTLTKVV